MAVHCVTPNPALDVTYRLTALEVHAVNRVSEVSHRPGGKGVNVARLAAAAGLEVSAFGFLGGACGEQLAGLLEDLAPAIRQRWTQTQVNTRTTIAAVDPLDTTMLNEPGTAVTDIDWHNLIAQVSGAITPGDVLTVSGSLPPNSSPERLGDLIAHGRQAGAIVIADTSGPALLAAAKAGAEVLKPNRDELLEVTAATDVDSGIEHLIELGAQTVVVSLGAQGLLAATASGTRIRSSLGTALHGNPTGAGDAVVAALAVQIAGSGNPGQALGLALPKAVAWGGAAVLAPVAGEIDFGVVADLATKTTTEELSCSHR